VHCRFSQPIMSGAVALVALLLCAPGATATAFGPEANAINTGFGAPTPEGSVCCQWCDATPETWRISEGEGVGCSMISPDCIATVNYPQNYPDDTYCAIETGSSSYMISFEDFNVEGLPYDPLIVDGRTFGGAKPPKDFVPGVQTQITWSSDSTVNHRGWKMCLRATCSSFTCPGNYVQRADASSRHCANMTCSEVDTNTCCELGCEAPSMSDLEVVYSLPPGCTAADGKLYNIEECSLKCRGDAELSGWGRFQVCNESSGKFTVPPCEVNVDPLPWDIQGPCWRYGPGCVASPGAGHGGYNNDEACNITALVSEDRASFYSYFVTNFDIEERHDMLRIGSSTVTTADVNLQRAFDIDVITWSSDASIGHHGWVVCMKASCKSMSCPAGYSFNCSAMDEWCEQGDCGSTADRDRCCSLETEEALGAGFIPGQAYNASLAGCLTTTSTTTTTTPKRDPDFTGHLIVTSGDSISNVALRDALESALKKLGNVSSTHVSVVVGNTTDGKKAVGYHVEQTAFDFANLSDKDFVDAVNAEHLHVEEMHVRSTVQTPMAVGADGYHAYGALCEDLYPCNEEDGCWQEALTFQSCGSLHQNQFCGPHGTPGPGWIKYYWWIAEADYESQYYAWDYWAYDNHFGWEIASQVCCTCGGGTCRHGSFKLLPGESNFCAPCMHGTTSVGQDPHECVPCEAGRYADGAGYAECLACPYGTFNNQTGQSECLTCGPGTATSTEAATECTLCPAGTFADPDTKKCEKCPAGTFSDKAGSSQCEKCEAGTHQPETGKAYCEECPLGTMTAMEGAQACIPCGAGTHSNLPWEGSTECVQCEAGRYNDKVGLSDCIPCPVGNFALEEGATQCVPCPSGTYAEEPGSPECLACQPGTASRYEGSASCIPCTPGKNAAESGSTECTDCKAGNYSHNFGASFCSRCPSGSYSPLDGRTSCEDCQVGRFADDEGGHSECHWCEPGSYAEEMASSRCTRCNETHSGEADFWTTMRKPTLEELAAGHNPEIWLEFSGAAARASCGCRPGTQPVGEVCAACGEGMVCEGMGVFYIKAGYAWDKAHSVWDCRKGLEEEACTGGKPGACASGRDEEAIACGQCMDGLMPLDDGTCVECKSSDYLVPFVAVIGGLVATVVAYCLFDKPRRKPSKLSVVLMVAALSQFLTIIQQLGIVSLIQVKWEGPVRDLLAFVSSLTFCDVQVFRPLSCVISMDVVSYYTMWVSFIFVCLGALVLGHFVSQLIHVHDWRNRWASLSCSAGMIMLTFYVSILATTLGPLQCKQHPNGRQTISWYQSVACWEGGEHTLMTIIGLMAAILPAAFLVVSIWAVRQLPRKLRYAETRFVGIWRFLFFMFSKEAYWYGPVMIIRNVLVSIVPMFSSPVYQILLLEVTLLCSLISVLRWMPWRVKLANHLDAAGHISLLMVTMMAAFFVEEDNAYFISLLSVLFICAIPACLLAAVVNSGLSLYKSMKRQYQFFLCHHNQAMGCFSRLLKMTLMKSAGVSGEVFMAADDLKSVDKLFDIVAHETETLVAVCSQQMLLKTWCVGEIATAHRSRVKMLAVYVSGAQVPKPSFIDNFLTYVPDISSLTQCGIDLLTIKQALVSLASSAAIRVPQELQEETITGLSTWLVSSKVGEKLSNKLGNGSAQAQVVIISDKSNLEAAATAFILRDLLNPIVEHKELGTASVLSLQECMPPGVKKAVLVCSNGVFTHHVLEALAFCADSDASVLPVLSATDFTFPSKDWMGEQRVFLQMSSTTRERAILVVRAIFTEIAIDFKPSTFSTGLAMFSKANEIAIRLFRIASVAEKVVSVDTQKKSTVLPMGTVSSLQIKAAKDASRVASGEGQQAEDWDTLVLYDEENQSNAPKEFQWKDGTGSEEMRQLMADLPSPTAVRSGRGAVDLRVHDMGCPSPGLEVLEASDEAGPDFLMQC